MTVAQPAVRSGTAGFTLVELLVGLAILSTIALVALPMTRTAFGVGLLETAAADLASAVRMTRASAVRNGTERTLSIDVPSRQYWADGILGRRTLPAGLSIEFDIPVSEQRQLTVQSIRFLPDGSSSGGRLILGRGSRTLSVTVDWLTGAPHVVR